MTTDPSPPAPVNSTDRNIQTARGLFSGHLTLPCSFVTFGIIVFAIVYLVSLSWWIDQVNQVRERLRESERLNHEIVNRLAPLQPVAPTLP